MVLWHLVGAYPQLACVVVVVVAEVEVGVVVVLVLDCVVVVVSVVGGDPQPARLADTRMLSKSPLIVVAAPPKLSTPKPIQSRDWGRARPDGTPDPMPCGLSQVTAFPET